MGKTVNEETEAMRKSAELEAKIKTSELIVRKYISALERENLKLIEDLTKCEAQKITLRSRLAIMKKELDARPEKAETIEDRIKRLTGKPVSIPPEFSHIVKDE